MAFSADPYLQNWGPFRQFCSDYYPTQSNWVNRTWYAHSKSHTHRYNHPCSRCQYPKSMTKFSFELWPSNRSALIQCPWYNKQTSLFKNPFILNRTLLNVLPDCPNWLQSTLVLIIAWRPRSNRPWLEPIMTQFIDPYRHHLSSMMCLRKSTLLSKLRNSHILCL